MTRSRVAVAHVSQLLTRHASLAAPGPAGAEGAGGGGGGAWLLERAWQGALATKAGPPAAGRGKGEGKGLKPGAGGAARTLLSRPELVVLGLSWAPKPKDQVPAVWGLLGAEVCPAKLFDASPHFHPADKALLKVRAVCTKHIRKHFHARPPVQSARSSGLPSCPLIFLVLIVDAVLLPSLVCVCVLLARGGKGVLCLSGDGAAAYCAVEDAWVCCDEGGASAVGGWEEVKSKAAAAKHQPLLLFFESPRR